MKKTVLEIASFLGGTVAGDGDVVIEHVRPIEEAGHGDLTFIANPRYNVLLSRTGASAILVRPGTACKGKNLVLVSDPYVSLSKLLALYYPIEPAVPFISPLASIDKETDIAPDVTIHPGVTVSKGARIGRGVVLYPGVYIGPDAVVSDYSVLYPNVCIYRGCRIGRHVTVHAGVVIGSDGFGFAQPGSVNLKVPQVGIVQIDDHVEIGANTTIDRATLGKTWIKSGVKIDNLVQIAHNVVIGENSVIVSQVGISGSTKLGRGVIIGGQAGLVGHLRIGDDVMIGAKSGVHDDVPDGHSVSGSPHLPHKQWLRVAACLARLPQMRKLLIHLSEKMAELEAEGKKE